VKGSPAALLLLLLPGCSDEVIPPVDGGGGGAGGGAAAAFRCPEVADAWPMVQAQRADGNTFCIDSREVTNDHYAAFLASGVQPEMNPQCAFVSDFTPKADWPPAGDRGAYPVGAVTWCDAYAFCVGVGKRMCGDSDGSIMIFDDSNNKEEQFSIRPTEMWSACTMNGAQQYAYGDEFESDRCNDFTMTPADVLIADAETSCEGGYSGIFFLQGNAYEWEGGCKWENTGEDGTAAICFNRGSNGCKTQAVGPNNDDAPLDWHAQISFRCCADAIDVE